MYYYQRIKDLREDADLTQKTVAAILNITPQQYSLYERGDREIPFHHAITLAKFYKVSLDYIAGLTNNKSISRSPASVKMLSLHRSGKQKYGLTMLTGNIP